MIVDEGTTQVLLYHEIEISSSYPYFHIDFLSNQQEHRIKKPHTVFFVARHLFVWSHEQTWRHEAKISSANIIIFAFDSLRALANRSIFENDYLLNSYFTFY